MEILNNIHQVQKNQATKFLKNQYQNGYEGDENVKYFTEYLTRSAANLQIRGSMANGVWIDDPVKLNIDTLVRVLECFFRASGLRINMSKSKIMGVNVEDAKVKIAANKLGCLVLKTPFHLLGNESRGNMQRKHSGMKWLKRFKWLWRFYSQKDSLWTKVIKALYGEDGSLDKVGASAARTCWTTIVQEVKVIQAQGINIHDFIKLKLGNGEDSRFWLEKWYEGGVLKRMFPRVYALELDKNISVSSKLKAPSLVTTFRRNARSGIEQTQFDSMAEIMKTISLVPRV
ncbi:hypothetical protein Tco_0209163 [Tanacetum coccineum]